MFRRVDQSDLLFFRDSTCTTHALLSRGASGTKVPSAWTRPSLDGTLQAIIQWNLRCRPLFNGNRWDRWRPAWLQHHSMARAEGGDGGRSIKLKRRLPFLPLCVSRRQNQLKFFEHIGGEWATFNATGLCVRHLQNSEKTQLTSRRSWKAGTIGRPQFRWFLQNRSVGFQKGPTL